MADMVISKHLAKWYQPDDPALRKHHIGIPLEYFRINGTNGKHLCHVLPLYDPTIEHVHDLYSPCQSFLKAIAYQMVDSMPFLHQRGIYHGDFRPANVMFCLLPGVDKWLEEKMIKLYGKPKIVRVHAVDEEGERDFEIEPNVPPYLIQTANFDLSSGACSYNIAVIDFGMAYFLDNPPTICAIPFELSYPERIFTNGRLGWPADICHSPALFFGPWREVTHSAMKTRSPHHGLSWRTWKGLWDQCRCAMVPCSTAVLAPAEN